MNRVVHKCKFCSKKFKKYTNFVCHEAICENDRYRDLKELDPLPSEYFVQKSAFNRSLNVFAKKFVDSFFDIESLLKFESVNLKIILAKCLKQLQGLKAQVAIVCEFYKIDGKEIDWMEPMFKSALRTFSSMVLFQDFLSEITSDIHTDFENFNQKGSGWVLRSVKLLELRVGKYIALSGGCSSLRLPREISAKGCLVQLQTTKDCFKWSIVAALHRAPNNPARISNYVKYVDKYDFKGLDEVVRLDQIRHIAKRNSMSINVYTVLIKVGQKPQPTPLLVCKEQKEKHVNLLLYNDHYYPILNFNRFIGNKKSRYHSFCYNCLTGFRSQKVLDEHIFYCKNFKAQKVSVPPDGSKLFFKQYSKQLKYPFIIYADFETLCLPVEKDGLHKHTFEYQEHTPSSFGYAVVDAYGKVLEYDSYRGENAGVIFLQRMKILQVRLDKAMAERKRNFEMTCEDDEAFALAESCHICEESFIDGQIRVKDHDHMTGQYRGAAHMNCNLQLQMPDDIPVVFHNLKNFDAHILLQGIESDMFDKISIIPQNMEKYISFSFGKLKFIDSYSFLSSSLETLAENLDEDVRNAYLKQIFKNEDISFVSKKARLPYDYLDSFDKFEEKSLPSIESFANKLKFERLSEDVYINMQNLWKHFNVRNLGEFQDIYQKIDVILLAAVFENFRGLSIQEFNLDPPHFYSAPGLTWAAALKKTRVVLDLLTDINMINMFEKSLRGGISSAMTRHVVANIPGTPQYDSKKLANFITYFDVNNLYGYALFQSLPIADFAWVDESEFDSIYKNYIEKPESRETETGFVFEVDLEYPEYLHDDHNDYPLAPDKLLIPDELLSDYQKYILKKTERTRCKSEKLIPCFIKREKYVVHYKNLAYYVKKGLKVTKVHRIIKFTQKPWLREYILLCTKKRQSCKSSFEKNFWKLLVNAIYGKSIEDVRKHTEIKLELTLDGAMKQMRKPMCEQFYLLDENKVLFKMKRKKVKLNKPIFVGFTVLEFSKLHMYQLHYEIFKRYFDKNIELLYTDTDSFIYKICTMNLHDDLRRLDYIFDFSDYPKDHISGLWSDEHKKSMGYLKDELNGADIQEFVALKPKVYAFQSSNEVKKTAKGVQKAVLKKQITLDDYKESLFELQLFHRDMRSIKSRKHKITSIQGRKLALNPFDDKRFLKLDGITSYAFGHYAINRS